MAELFERQPSTPVRDSSVMTDMFEQAIGMIASHFGVSAAAARQKIRSHGFETGRPVDEIVRDVVAFRLDFVDPTLR